MPLHVQTRRGLLTAALAGGAGGSLVALLGSRPAPAETVPSDGQLTAGLVAVELLAIAVCERVLATPLLSERARRVARTVLSHEQAHAAAVEAELVRVGGTSPRAPKNDDEIDQQLSTRHVSRTVTGLSNEHDCLDLLLDMEGAAEGAYYAAISKLRHDRLLVLSAQILGSEAQHEAVLGELRHGKDFSRAAPYAFVEGIRP